MAISKTLNTRIQLKYDTLANWTSNDPTLKAGEVAIVEIPANTGASQKEPIILMKVGDGTKTFTQLDYIGAYAIDVYSWAKAASKPEYAANEIKNLASFVQANQIADTNTKYQLIKNSDYSYSLQSKELNGTWATDFTFTIPDKDTTYTFATGTTNGTIAVTPSGGSLQEVAVKGLGSAAYTSSTAYDAAGAASAVLGTTSDAATAATVYGAKAAAAAASTAAASAQSTADDGVSKANAAQITANAAVKRAGDTMTGALILSGAPSADLQAATKKYVDDKTAALSGATHFVGVKTSLPTSASSGDICIVGKKEYIYDGTSWQELGDESLYVQKEEGKGLSTNDYTDAEKTKLAGIAAGAEVNVQSDWSVSDTSSDAYIKNKPSALKNPNALTFGSKSYDGSAALTITASDLGALTAHQDISGKQDNLSFDGTYNASTNKVATVSTVNNAIDGLADIADTGNVNDLIQTAGDVLLFYCGNASTIW